MLDPSRSDLTTGVAGSGTMGRGILDRAVMPGLGYPKGPLGPGASLLTPE